VDIITNIKWLKEYKELKELKGRKGLKAIAITIIINIRINNNRKFKIKIIKGIKLIIIIVTLKDKITLVGIIIIKGMITIAEDDIDDY